MCHVYVIFRLQQLFALIQVKTIIIINIFINYISTPCASHNYTFNILLLVRKYPKLFLKTVKIVLWVVLEDLSQDWVDSSFCSYHLSQTWIDSNMYNNQLSQESSRFNLPPSWLNHWVESIWMVAMCAWVRVESPFLLPSQPWVDSKKFESNTSLAVPRPEPAKITLCYCSCLCSVYNWMNKKKNTLICHFCR